MTDDAPSTEPLLSKTQRSSPLRRLGLLLAIGAPLYALSVGGAYAYGRVKVQSEFDEYVAAELDNPKALGSSRHALKTSLEGETKELEVLAAQRSELEFKLRETPARAYEGAQAKLQRWLEAEGSK